MRVTCRVRQSSIRLAAPPPAWRVWTRAISRSSVPSSSLTPRERAGLLLHPPRRTPFAFRVGNFRSSWVSRRTSNSLVLTMILMMSVISPIPSSQNLSGT